MLDKYKQYKLHSKGERTTDRYVRTLSQLKLFTGKEPEDITEDDLYRFLDTKQCKENTKNQYKVHFRDFLRFCERRNIRTKCKTILIEMQKTRNDSHKPLWGRERDKLLASLPSSSFRERRDALLIHLLCDTGARVSEITDLKLCDIRERHALIETKKTHTKRHILWGRRTERLLHSYLAERDGYPRDTLFIGIGRDGVTKLTSKTVQRIFKRACRRAGLSGYVPHSCRHGKAVELAVQGRSMEEIRRMLGHSTILSVQTYLQENDVSFYRRMRSPLLALVSR